MGRIKIKDLPKDVEISKEEMKKMTGGGFVISPYSVKGSWAGPGGPIGPGGKFSPSYFSFCWT